LKLTTGRLNASTTSATIDAANRRVSLILKNVREDFYKYTYTGQVSWTKSDGDYEEVSSIVRLQKAEVPKIQKDLDVFPKKEVKVGESNFHMVCRATGKPAPKLCWWKKKELEKEGSPEICATDEERGSESSPDTSMVVMTTDGNVTKDMRALYVCKAENIAGTALNESFLWVAYIEYEETKEKSETKKIGDRLDLDCRVRGLQYTGDEQISYKWINPAGNIIAHMKEHNLVLSEVNGLGVYKCEANNVAGTLVYTVNVNNVTSEQSENPIGTTSAGAEKVQISARVLFVVSVTGVSLILNKY